MPTAAEAKAYVNSLNQRQRKPIPEFLRKAAKPIYIYNIYQRDHMAYLGGLGRKYVPACPPDKPYSEPCIIDGTIFDEYDTGNGRGDMDWLAVDGMDVAKAVTGQNSHSVGLSTTTTNMEWWGVFIAAGEVPTEAELAEAKRKLTECFKMWLANGDALALRGAEGIKEIGIPHRQAAAFLKQPREWANPIRALVECPGCGEGIKQNIAKCPHCGAIIDKQKAIDLGLIPAPVVTAPLPPAEEIQRSAPGRR